MRLTVIRNGSRDITNCGVRIVMCRPCNGIASTAVTTDKPCEGGNCLVTNLSAGIRGQNLDKVGYNIGDANILVAAPLTGEAVQSTLAGRRERIAQSTAKGVAWTRRWRNGREGTDTHRQVRISDAPICRAPTGT